MNSKSLARLLERVPAPTSPVSNTGDWEAVEKRLGFNLPNEYKCLIESYGTGVFDPLEIWVWNFFDSIPDFEYYVRGCESAYNKNTPSINLKSFLGQIPVFPWGGNWSRILFYWVQDGPPDHWYVIVVDNMLEFAVFRDLTLCKFLEEVLIKKNNELFYFFGADNFEPDDVKFLPPIPEL